MIEHFGLYLVITDPVAGYDACTEAAVECGVSYVQLRMKERPYDEVVRTGRRMRAITQDTPTRFIVNDDVSVARTLDADGVHLGQADMNLTQARSLWPSEDKKLFGLSTHDEAQAATALAQQPDYIGVGPVYATPTKRIADPVLGVARAANIVNSAPMTAVAIGGIDLARLAEVLRAGIRNFAVVRYVCQDRDPTSRLRELMNLWQDARRNDVSAAS